MAELANASEVVFSHSFCSWQPEKLILKFLLVFLKGLILNLLIETLLRLPNPAFRQPHKSSKTVSKVACDHENCSEVKAFYDMYILLIFPASSEGYEASQNYTLKTHSNKLFKNFRQELSRKYEMEIRGQSNSMT